MTSSEAITHFQSGTRLYPLYVPYLSDTGGWIKPEDAMNCDGKDCNMFANAVRASLCIAVSAQTRLLLRLHEQGLIN